MAYTIELTNGTLFATIADGTINTDSSMVLVGKNYAGYGEFLDQNFIRLLQNNACPATTSAGTNPANISAPITGQLWWNTTNNVMRVWNGTLWKTLGGATIAPASSSPASPAAGDFWFDSTNQQLRCYNGTSWVLIGPATSSGQGTSGAVVETVSDGTLDHVVVFLYVADTIVASISKDATFTPQTAISGFATIGPGVQLSSTVTNNLFRGTATDSQALGGAAAANYLRSDQNDSTTGELGVLNNLGVVIGAGQAGRISSPSGTGLLIQNQLNNQNVQLQANVSGTPTVALEVQGTTGNVSIPTRLSVTGNVSGNYFIGNGSLLTGIAGGGGTSITNGTSNVSIPIANGNVNVAVGGSNRIAVTTTGAEVAGAVTATGNITAGTGAFFIGNGSLLTGIAGGGSSAEINATNTVTGNVYYPVFVSASGTNSTARVRIGTTPFSYDAANNVLSVTATAARYADIAERFSAMQILEPGTVVEIGGPAEIQPAQQDLSDQVFGVISSRAAHLMNSGAGDDTTHPPVAMTGRVPVRVIGPVIKGDRLVSAGQGLARAARPGEATAFNTLGRALVDKLDHGEQLVEAVVNIR